MLLSCLLMTCFSSDGTGEYTGVPSAAVAPAEVSPTDRTRNNFRVF
jgi:hypothetical protein